MKPLKGKFRTAFLLLAGGLAACVAQPLPVESPFNKGVELYDQGRLAEAAEQYRIALQTDSGNIHAQYNLAVVLHDLGRLDDAVALYKDILQHSENTNSRINLAAILMQRGERDRAFAELELAAQRNPLSAHPLSIRGEYLEREGNDAEALSHYQRAIAVDDKHAPSHHRLGRLLARKEQGETALAHLRRAVELDGRKPEYLDSLSREYEKQGKLMEAINALERASVLDRDRGDFFARLGDLYKSSGLHQEAVSRYWSALAINNDNLRVHRNLKELLDDLAENERLWLNSKGEKEPGEKSLALKEIR